MKNRPRGEMKILDANCGLGWVPGKTCGARDPDTLLAMMDRVGIEQALVFATYARKGNWQQGNAWLMDAIKGHDRLLPCWVIAPEPLLDIRPAEWVARLKRAGVGAVRLCPSSQHHLVNPEVCGSLLQALARARVPVILDFEIVGWGPSLDWPSIASLATAFPELPLILPGSVLGASRNIHPYFQKHSQLYLDIGAYQEVDGIASFIREFGAHRAVFGTYFPDRGPEIALGLLHGRQLGPRARRAIAGGNMAALIAGRTPQRVPAEPAGPDAKMPVPAVDVHVHVGGYAFGGEPLTAEQAVKAFDAWGVQCGVASGLVLIHSQVREANQVILQACRKFPGRLYGWAFYDAAQPELSASVCQEMLNHPFFVGFKVYGPTEKRMLDDPGYNKMFAMADKHRLPILAHEDGYEDWSKTLTKLGKKWPHANILHAHHGGCQDEAGAARLAALLKKHDNLWHDTVTSGGPPDTIGHLVRATGGKRLCYGTDLAFMDVDGQNGKVLFADLTEVQRADVLRNNAVRLLPRLRAAGRRAS